MQACVWTGNAECSANNCTSKCIANLYPALIVTPVLSGVAYQSDAFFEICPELALTVHRLGTGWYALRRRGLTCLGLRWPGVPAHVAPAELPGHEMFPLTARANPLRLLAFGSLPVLCLAGHGSYLGGLG